MDAVSVIARKRDGNALSRDEIHHFLSSYMRGEIPDYQMSALLMAICIQGMELDETIELTRAMIESGRLLDLSAIPGRKVDKHSTGGVGDKTSLVVVALAASAGAVVPKLAGRALGHTGGTIDKLESIPGLTTELESERFLRQLCRVGAAISAQTSDIAPADKQIYALRDVTGTVGSIPLITASVASKKVAAGAGGIVLDVKSGAGALVSDASRARLLARWLVDVIRGFSRSAIALVTDMEQPLGATVGNALEVAEAVDVLRGEGPLDLRCLCLELAATMLLLAGERDIEACRGRVADLLDTGAALEKFAEIVHAQGGDPRVVTEPRAVLPSAKETSTVRSRSDGYVTGLDAAAIGRACMLLGAGRRRVGEDIDPAAGVVLQLKIGDAVSRGDELATMHASSLDRLALAEPLVYGAYRVADRPPQKRRLILDVID
ncbi:MAG: thymidine phosphorylase [Actinobacteria bacterium]|nr:MAG: thymidine phosphorylase [Actinomycetota bacterium]